jgi:hypothetical protein
VIDRIDVHNDRLAIRLRSQENPGTTNLADDIGPSDDHFLSIPWQKPPSKRFRQILLPHGVSRKEVRPERPERRLRLVRAIARGRRWLDEIVSSSVTDAEQIALRERCSVRQVNMTISLAFLAPTSALRSRGVCLGAHRTAARCSCRMETALRSAWVESATIAHVSKTPLLPRHRLLCPIWRRESPPKYQLNICFVSVPGCRLNYIHFSIHRKLKSARGR